MTVKNYHAQPLSLLFIGFILELNPGLKIYDWKDCKLRNAQDIGPQTILQIILYYCIGG